MSKSTEKKTKRKRTYASYWEFPNEAARDKGIVCDLVDSLGSDFFKLKDRSLKARGHDDPPDCEARDLADNKVAFELTELVDPKAVMENTQGKGPHYREYSPTEFLAALDARITAKARELAAFKGGPYSRYVLVLHTDEPMLNADFCREALTARPDKYVSPWTDIFMIFPPPPDFSGRPSLRRCPVVRVENVE